MKNQPFFQIFQFFSKFSGLKFGKKTENHKDSHSQMKVMPKILLQTNFWPQWTIFWGRDRFLKQKFFIFWAKFLILKPPKTPNFVRPCLGNRQEVVRIVNSFWKLDNQGYNISLTNIIRKKVFYPPPILTQETLRAEKRRLLRNFEGSTLR